MNASRQWTLGVLIGLPLLFLLALVIVGCGIGIYLYFDKRTNSDYDLVPDKWGKLGSIVIASLLLVILIGATIWGYWPLKSEYHQYRSVNGVVAKISSRFVGSGNTSTTQKYVVVLTKGPQQYGILDTRASLLKPGDNVSLRCIRVYEYGSNAAGYDCKWGK